jgi:4-hydroxy-tetrahydrodipicolinate synthase
MITPLNADLTVDAHAARRLARRLVARGVNALFLLGTAGEFPLLDLEEKVKLVAAVVDEVAGSVSVIANVSETCLHRTVRTLKELENCGVAGVVIMPPYYFNVRSREELKRYLAAVSRVQPGTA